MGYLNADGLYLKTGTAKATANVAGEYKTFGNLRDVEIVVDLTALTESETIISDTTFIPAGVRIQEIVIVTETVAATGTAIDLGLIKADRATQIDYDGLLAAFPTASMNAAGEQNLIVDNTTYDGALVGTTTAYVGYLTCSRTDSTAFTTGKVRIRVRYYKP